MKRSWTEEAERELLSLGAESPGWGYIARGTPCVEPTVLASLALLSSEEGSAEWPGSRAVRRAADWLRTIQRSDGSLGPSAGLSEPGWPTPYAILLWAATGLFEAERRRAVDWLLGVRPRTYARDPVFGDDTTLSGWPWVDGTYSWLEPTAMALIALRIESRLPHARVREGLRLILDRSIPAGGWNYGSSLVYGRPLRPQPAPTGLALVALSGGEPANGEIERACVYLRQTLPAVRSAQSLCWGLLGLKAWGVEPPEARRWLQEAYDNRLRALAPALHLSYLILAEREGALGLLGCNANGGARP